METALWHVWTLLLNFPFFLFLNERKRTLCHTFKNIYSTFLVLIVGRTANINTNESYSSETLCKTLLMIWRPSILLLDLKSLLYTSF